MSIPWEDWELLDLGSNDFQLTLTDWDLMNTISVIGEDKKAHLN